jgi:ribosomal protein S18 acetylase RimI-like enzyme
MGVEEYVTLRAMNKMDHDAVVDIWDRAGLPYRPNGRDGRTSIEKELQKDTAIFFVAESDGVMIATALCTHDGRKGWINRLAVVPEMQGKGIGKLMVQYAERAFRDKGFSIFSCLIGEENTRSQQMFETLGYERQKNIAYFSKKMDKDI